MSGHLFIMSRQMRRFAAYRLVEQSIQALTSCPEGVRFRHPHCEPTDAMQNPLQIVFRDIPSSEAIDAEVRKRVAKLEKLCGDMVACKVSVEADGKHKTHGNMFKVRVDITVPGNELVVDGHHTTHEDAYVAVRDSFDAAARQLEEYVQRRRRDVKTHAA